MSDTDRLFVLGLDGVPWSFIEKWTTTGRLPNFERIVREGAAGPLQSTTPASTPLAWPSIATGTWPDGHGVYSFQRPTPEYTNEMYTAADVQGTELWDVLSPAVVANVPMTYPVDEIDGKMVGGMLSPGQNEQFAHPRSLADEIDAEIPDYQIGLTWSEYVDRERELVDDINSLLDSRRDLMQLLMRDDDWRLFFFTYTEPDRLQHLVWDESLLLEHYRKLDDVLGEVLDYVEERDATLFVVSDHGFGPVEKKVAANTVLEEEGFLTRRGDTGGRSVLESIGVNKSNLRAAFDRIGVNENKFIRKYVPQSAADYLASAVPGDHFLYDVDHSETRAFVHEFGNLYVNDAERFVDGAVAPGDVASTKRELEDLFSEITDPETGKRMLDVHDGAELFPRDERSPDLVLEPKDGFGVSFSMSESRFIKPKAEADHESEGIFLAWGSDIEPGARPESASVVDVAPTGLHLTGRAVPDGADGRVLREIIGTGSESASRSVSVKQYDDSGGLSDATDDYENVKERLQGLGYVE